MRLTTNERSAKATTELLGEVFDPAETAIAAFEVEETGDWLLEAYFTREPNRKAIIDLIRPLVGEAADAAIFTKIDPKDWVAASLEGLKPVRAGRFLVHGAHDAASVAINDLAIEIEAALAFGTGHHGTTRGCLLALSDELKRRRPAHVLDVGTGTGILAFAAAKALKTRIVAGDIDPIAIDVARGNARLNGIAPWLSFYVAPGLRHPATQRTAGYDLVFANILARPLMKLATSISPAVAPGGRLILSGLLLRDVPGVLSAYAGCGLALVRKSELEGWATLVLARGGSAARRRRQSLRLYG